MCTSRKYVVSKFYDRLWIKERNKISLNIHIKYSFNIHFLSRTDHDNIKNWIIFDWRDF